LVEIDFYIDPETGLPRRWQHGVTEDEVFQVLRRPGEERAGDEGSRVAIGQTAAGRYLKVTYARDPDGLFVITEYELRGKPLKAYRRRRRRRPR
jgi:hypothetical protein